MADPICAWWEGRLIISLIPIGQWGLPRISDTHIYIIILFHFRDHPMHPKQELGIRLRYNYGL